MSQQDLFESIPKPGSKIKIQDGAYRFWSHFYSETESDDYFERLMSNVDWKLNHVKMFGKTIPQPRLTAWYGENDTPYFYSGIRHENVGWTPELLKIKKKVEELSGYQFNSVLLNRYRDGNDSMSWHADNEKELGENPVIASVNFGATRVFQLRHNTSKKRIDIPMTHGSLLIMEDELQHHWQHKIPKTKKKIGERINLTFRLVKS